MFYLISKFVWDFFCSVFFFVEEDIVVDKCIVYFSTDFRYRRLSVSLKNRSRRKFVGISDFVEVIGLLGFG